MSLRKWSISLLAFLSFGLSGICQETEGGDSTLFGKLDEYLEAIDKLPLEQAQAEVDFIISSVSDSTLRNRVASRAYRHFRDSKVMGSENVTIYIYDEWFATFRTVFDTIEEFDEAGFYAELNRPSLMWKKARHLQMEDLNGKPVRLPAEGRLSVIYFYSTECPKCLYNSIRIRNFLNAGRYRLNFYAVYTGEDDAGWKQYTMKELKIRKSCRTKVFHLKGGDSSYVLDYAVIQTPRLFLVSGDGTIIGRNLDSEALEQLIGVVKP